MLRSLQSYIRDDSRRGKNRKWLFTALFFCVLVTVAIVIIPWQETWQILAASNLVLIGFATLLTLPNHLLSTASYTIVASKQNIALKFWSIFEINLIMSFYDIVLPSTFFVSGLRWYRYNQHSKKPAQTLTSIAYLKAFNFLLTLLLSLGTLLFFETTTIKGYSFGIIALIIGIALILYLAPIICKKILVKLPTPMESQTKLAAKPLFYKYFYKAISAFANFQNLDFKTQLLLIGLGIASQGIQYYTYILIAQSVGIHLSLAQLGAIIAILLLVANLPINFSVGISLRDVTLVSLLVAINVPLEQAAAMSIVVMAKSFFYGIIGGLIEAVQLLRKKKLEVNPK